MENIDIDKDNLKNIDIDIDMAILENSDIDKGILQNIDIDEISYRLGFGISNTPSGVCWDYLIPQKASLRVPRSAQKLFSFAQKNWPKNPSFGALLTFPGDNFGAIKGSQQTTLNVSYHFQFILIGGLVQPI